MSEARDDIKATSEAIIADAERIQEIEARKQQLEPGDPSLEELALESERLGLEVAVKTKIETDLAEEAAESDD